jgi:hypothetical protein
VQKVKRQSRGSGGIAPPFLTSALQGGEWSASCPYHFPLRKESLVTIGYGSRWVPGSVWMLWKRQKYCTSRNKTLCACDCQWMI